jgi:hypothetical protein
VLHPDQAEARLAARQQARYEARNIRMRELEKKARDEEEGGSSPLNSINHSGTHSGRFFSNFLCRVETFKHNVFLFYEAACDKYGTSTIPTCDSKFVSRIGNIRVQYYFLCKYFYVQVCPTKGKVVEVVRLCSFC